MHMVDWLLTEQLVEIFTEATTKRPALNAVLEAHSPHGEDDVLAGAGTAVRVDARDGSTYLVTPRRMARLVDAAAFDLVSFSDLIGYDWISPEMSEKVALKDEHYDRLYLYPRDAPPIVLNKLGDAVYPLITFLGRVLEFQSQKVILPKLDDDVVDVLGRCLLAVARGPFWDDAEVLERFGRSRESLRVIAGMWPRMNLAAPEVPEVLGRAVEHLLPFEGEDPELWAEWIQATPVQVEAAFEVFRRVAAGEV